MKNNKFTDGKTGDKGGEMKKTGKRKRDAAKGVPSGFGGFRSCYFAGTKPATTAKIISEQQMSMQTICTGLLFLTRLTNLSNFSK